MRDNGYQQILPAFYACRIVYRVWILSGTSTYSMPFWFWGVDNIWKTKHTQFSQECVFLFCEKKMRTIVGFRWNVKNTGGPDRREEERRREERQRQARDVDDLDHIDDVNSDVTQSPNTEWPHQNLPCIKCMPLRREGNLGLFFIVDI